MRYVAPVRRTLLLASMVITLAVSACGGSSSSGVSAAAYVKSVCTAVRSWANDIAARSNALNVTSIKSAAEGKTAIQGFFEAAVADTTTVVSKLKSAGTPNVNNGKQISTALVNSFAQIETALSSGKTQAAALPTNNPQAFKTAGQTLANSVRSSLANIGSSLNGLKSPELQAAASKEPACSTVGA
jgi:hypothetical protein